MSRRRKRRSRARENPSNTTWLLIGGGVVVAGVAAYFLTNKTASAATTSAVTGAPAPPQLTSAPQSVTVKVGDKINPPVLPTLPSGWSWQPDPGYVNTSIALAVLQPQPGNAFVAVGPGTETVPFVASQHGPGPSYTGQTTFTYIITVTP